MSLCVTSREFHFNTYKKNPKKAQKKKSSLPE
jgi:hypothetical protein